MIKKINYYNAFSNIYKSGRRVKVSVSTDALLPTLTFKYGKKEVSFSDEDFYKALEHTDCELCLACYGDGENYAVECENCYEVIYSVNVDEDEEVA